jgi:hypothetical protein
VGWDLPPSLLPHKKGNIRLATENVGPPSAFGLHNLPSIDREGPILPNEKEIVGPIVPALEIDFDMLARSRL